MVMVSKKVSAFLKKSGVSDGDSVKFRIDGVEYTGILLPNNDSSSDTVMIKLNSGYNVGFDVSVIKCLTKVGKRKVLGDL